jgi:glycosyltransferase involved in cell wall biosynthesis
MINVIVVDVKGLITQSGHDVVVRHDAYGAALKVLEPNSRLYILSRYEVQDQSLAKNIEIISVKSLFGFFGRGGQLLRSLKGRILLVSGDPWESFFSCVVLRVISKRQAPIQVQIHADVGSSIWKRLNWRNKIRAKTISFSLKYAEQIRCVSRKQLTNLEKTLPLVGLRSVVIPVPIKVDTSWAEKRKFAKNCSIAIVGRIHKDRGLEEFIRVCKVLVINYPDLRINVVGDGPHEEWFKSTLKKEGLLEHSTFFGNLSQQDLSLVWQTFGCVASFAPSEAYGRTARESLIYGVPVLAMRSSGLEELGNSLDKDGVWFLDGLNDGDISNLFGVVSEFIVAKRVSELVIDEVNSLNEKIAKSWITGSMLPLVHRGRLKR